MQQDGFVYATGYFQGTVDFDPGTGVYNLSATGADATFFLKLDTAGNFIWAKSISGTSSILAFDIDVDVTGNVIAGGEFWGTCDFNPGTGIQSKSATNFSSDAFLLKLDANGNFVWVDIFNGDNDEWVKSIDLHSNGDVGVCGVFQGTTDFSPGAGTYNLTSNGNYDVFIARMNADGSLNWAGAVGGTFNDQLGELDISMSGDYFLTGGFSGSVDFDPGAGNYTINGPGSTNIFYLQLNSSGTFVNAYGFGTINSSSIGNSIHADDAGRITMAGGFEQTIDFDPGIAVYNLTSILGTSDCFVLQLNSCIPAETSINATICTGDSIFASGEYQTMSGEYIDYLTASDGCDSIVTLHLTVLPSANNNVIAAICEGDNYLFEGSTLTDAGIYTVHLVAGNGCDSTITLTLTVHPNYETILNATICEGNTFPFNGNEIDSTGTYMANLLATTGCDSMITLHLEVLPIMNTEISENICEGETFLFNGMTLNTAGDYSAALISNSGCDSLVTLHLTETIINAAVMQSNDTLFATGNGSIQWILCESGLPIPGADQTIFIPIQAGTYAAVFTNGNCSDTTVCKYYTVINAPVANFNVEVYPNPAREKITIQISDYSFPVTAELRNVFGELIEQKEFSKIVTFELQELPSGIYFLPIFSTNNSVIKNCGG
ncbi:MAG: T9SS type A sorting domain-containing protein [Chitinophagaceae bacterium]|nr:T9SS type A sorting domain-containing protein [Chitinophagaceae bacterium]